MAAMGPAVGDARGQARAYRVLPAGPQEAEEWTQALENVTNRLVAIEATQRKVAQTLTAHEKQLNNVTSRVCG